MIKVEHAPAIRAFDYVAAVTFGAVSALMASLFVPGAFPMPLAMIVGMLVGTLSAVPVLGLFTYLLGGFEIVVMSAQIGMLAGMVGAMTAWDPADAAIVGSLAGLSVQVVLHVADTLLHGEVRRP